MGKFKFFENEDNSVATVSHNVTPQVAPVIDAEYQNKKYRYRVEQVVLTKFNGEIVSHGTTKQEYTFQKNFANNNIRSIDIELLENVINFDPPQLQEAIKLICDLDIVKCDATLSVDEVTGKVNGIVDNSRIRNRWQAYRQEISKTFDFVKSVESKQNIQNFLLLGDQQIGDDTALIADYQSKLFFDIVFDKYLVSNEVDDAYEKTFISNLFDMRHSLISVGQFITIESPEAMVVKRTGKLNDKTLDANFMIEQYDQKFKPYVGFKFSEYDYRYTQNTTINTKENIITKAELTITEEVKNNVQIVVNYELKQVDL